MTVHHTAVPADDGGNAARRMRQMQAFHIDNRGWCDIGYHFVVSKSGKIFRGRKTEQRTGAHVGGENHGNVGTALIGNFDRQKLKPQQRRPATWVLGWLHEKHDIALDPGHLKGHTQWPNQATSCPGDRVLSRLTSLRNRADRRADSDDRLKIAVTSTVVGAPDRYTQGSSDGVIDPLPGQTVRARLTVENNTGRALSDVRLGYSLASPHLDAADYRIEASPKEKSSWSRDEASRASENPDPSAIGKKGAFHLKTLRPGEAKRAVVALKASRFSLGQTDHPGVRAWLWRAGKAYGDQSGWSDRPQTGERGPNKRARSEIDVPSRDHWAFEETSGPQHLEGWTACCGDDWDRVALNTKAGALALHATGSDARLRAPDWTRLDADRWDQLVLKLRSHDGPHRAAVYWAGPDEQLAESRSVEFRAPGDGDFHTLVVPLGRLEQWAGTVAKLRIDPLDDRAPADGATAWYDLAHAYFQDSTDRVTTAAQQSFRSHAPVDLLDAPAGSDPPPGVGGTDPRGGGRSRTVVANTPPAGDVEVNSAGCSSVDPVQSPSRWPLVALVVVLGAARFRRRK
ncbi:MAG: peptidoglycan recognition family protein [Bradymonadaceae bacterium]